MSIFLTSHLKNYIKENNEIIPIEINNDNKLLDQLKSSIKSRRGIAFFASSKYGYEKTDSYAINTFKSLKLSGINFDNYYIVDGRTKEDIKTIISNSDVIFLAGGDTLEEITFFEEINLRELLKDYNGVIIGQSAGSINLACDVYNSPESTEDLKKESKWMGLCKTNINIEPHFVYSDKNFDEGEKIQRKEVLKESFNRTSFGICDGSHIFVDDGKAYMYGEGYIIKDGKINKYCDNNDNKKILG